MTSGNPDTFYLVNVEMLTVASIRALKLGNKTCRKEVFR